MPRHQLDYQSPHARPTRSVFESGCIGAIIGAGLTLPAIALAMSSYSFAQFSFPYPVLLAHLTKAGSAIPLIILAFLQLPMECALIGLAIGTRRLLLGCVVIGVHFFAVGLCVHLGLLT